MVGKVRKQCTCTADERNGSTRKQFTYHVCQNRAKNETLAPWLDVRVKTLKAFESLKAMNTPVDNNSVSVSVCPILTRDQNMEDSTDPSNTSI